MTLYIQPYPYRRMIRRCAEQPQQPQNRAWDSFMQVEVRPAK